jgi:hypothetical protein
MAKAMQSGDVFLLTNFSSCDNFTEKDSNMHKVLNYFFTKHPKLVSAVSTVLITVGSIALHPGVAACVGGPTLAQHAVQAVGAVAVAVGKWLRTALNSATTKAAEQAQLSD